MLMVKSELLADERRILSVWYDNAEKLHFSIGEMGCTGIRVYGEPAEFCVVAWIAIEKGDGVVAARIPAYKLTISYVS